MSVLDGAVHMLVDLGPAVEVALVGAVLAVLPVLWVAVRLRRQGARGWGAWQRSLTLATLFLTIDLVAFGAFTRLTDSGLGCPDWPGCYGSASPMGAHHEISKAQIAAPTGPVTHGKAWIEMVHRYLATGVGALITLLMTMAWWSRWGARAATPARSVLSPWWPTWTWLWVCAQGAFGALTVTLKLFPLVVTGHLLGGLLGVALLTAQAQATSSAPVVLPRSVRRGAALVLVLWFAQAALGGWVSTNGAVLACAEVPLCQGRWWPSMDWAQGFNLWRALGEDGAGGHVTLPALTAIHMTHRLGALVATAAVLMLAWRTRLASRRDAQVLLALLAAQLLSGLSNVVLGWPLFAALAHTLGAALMVAWLTRMAILPRPQQEAIGSFSGVPLPAPSHAPSLS